MALRAVVFDCDGVLFGSEAANVAFYNEVLRRAGEESIPPCGALACHTLASAQLFQSMFSDRPEALARVRRAAEEVDYGPFYELMVPRPGLFSVLETLASAYRLAMATNRGKTAAGVVERFGLRPYFELTVGVLHVARPKPYPDMLLHCLRHFCVDPGEAIYVGDQQIDADAAEAAGVTFVAMGDGVPTARHRISDLRELIDVAKRL